MGVYEKGPLRYILYFVLVLLLIIFIGYIFRPNKIPMVNGVIIAFGGTIGLVIVDTIIRKRRR